MFNIKDNSIEVKGYGVYGYEDGGFVVSPHLQPKKFNGEKLLWLLPEKLDENSLFIKCGKYSVKKKKDITYINFEGSFDIVKHSARPSCDFYGNFVTFNTENGQDFEKAYAHFYWDNLLPQMAERTFMRKKKKIRDGYVLSTLNKKFYGGTYPAVDHEFHFKGRFAVGGEIEKSLFKRMLELQLRIMREDKKGLSRNVCSVQPSGRREYNVWRLTKDLSCKAQMFRITANIEFIEAVHLYYSMTKDIDFLKDNISAFEKNCSYIESFIDKNGLLNSHVYYEDQVIKNGYVAQAQCFAINAFKLMSEIESLLERKEKAFYYGQVSEILGKAAVKDLPNGFWDKKNERFVDWIDINGGVHDHVHLLANELPALFSLSSKEQTEKCDKLIKAHNSVFSKFPSFVSAKIEDYTKSEIGIGGPYDLCAAGRYWCWDASYKAFQKDSDTLLKQLKQVSEQAKIDNYLMGERYDMNYIYYIDDKNWHGSSLYYEYPNVFLYVLMTKYLGISYDFHNDLKVIPLVKSSALIKSETHGIEYSVNQKEFTITNFKEKDLKVSLDLTGIGFDVNKTITLEPNKSLIFNH